MRRLEEYRDRYENVRMTRDEMGILEVTLHTNGDSLRWVLTAHRCLTEAFRDIALDKENRVILITGTGDEFLGPRADSPEGQMKAQTASAGTVPGPDMWLYDGFLAQREKMGAILDIPVPVVCAVNGPVRRHCETALLADVIIASDTASFEDSAHFDLQDLVPGDGCHTIFHLLLGINRGRAFMYQGTIIEAQEALRLGLVAEVVPKGQELERARQVARRIAEKSDSTLRLTRALLVEPLKREALGNLGLGLLSEGLAALGARKP